MIKLSILILLAALLRPLMADDIVVKEIGGVPIIRTKIHYGDKEIEASILIDLGSNTPMVIHERCLGGLDLHPMAAEGQEVDIEFAGNFRWKGVPMHVEKRVPLIETLTRDFSRELDEVPVVAIVGLPAIKSNVVELDLRRGLLRTLGLASGVGPSEEINYEAKPYGIVMQGTGPTGAAAKVRMNLSGEDSMLDMSLLQAARKAGKTPNLLEIGGIKFSDQTAFRFEWPDPAAPERIDAVLGVSAVRNFIVTMWPKRGKIAFAPHPPVPFPQATQDYFFALADKKPDAVLEFISKSPPGRLRDDACLALWKMRLDDAASTTDLLQQALETIGANYFLIRRSSALGTIADELESSGRPDKEQLVMLALNLAMKQSGKALDQTAAQAIHLRLGKRALAAGDPIQARRHLLSAAFGLPKDGACNFWLGEVYREMGKPGRAWSRYFQGILDPQMSEPYNATLLKDSLARLDELNHDPEFRKTFNMVVAEQYMAGRLLDAEFHAPSRYSLVKKQFPGHVKLVEFFTNATDAESGGMQLAFQSLDEHFGGEVALIEYHLDDPMHRETARQRLEFYEGKRAPLAVFDGVAVLKKNISTNKKLADNAAECYPAFRDASQFEKAAPDSGWTLNATMAQDDMKVSGSITATGQGSPDKLRIHAVLCERSVMAVEANKVFFHHFVARQALTPPDGLDLKAALEKPFAFAVDAEKMRENQSLVMGESSMWFSTDPQKMLGNLTKTLASSGPSKPSYVDPNKLIVVVFVQQMETRRVLEARSFSLPQKEEQL